MREIMLEDIGYLQDTLHKYFLWIMYTIGLGAFILGLKGPDKDQK